MESYIQVGKYLLKHESIVKIESILKINELKNNPSFNIEYLYELFCVNKTE